MPRKYTNEDVYKALKEVEEGATIAASARKFGVPRSTLSEKRSGRHPIECRMGPDTVLSKDEEDLLEEWIFYVGDVGFPVSKRQLLDSVQMILNKSKRKTVFTNNRPGRKWYAAFRKRHPKVVEKESQNLTRARATVTEEDLRKWYAGVHETLSKMKQLDILDDPSRIFNMDESGFYLSPEPGKVLARRGDRRVYSKIDNDDKECIITLIGGNASGQMTPQLVMFPYQRLPSNIVNGMPKTWAFGRSTTGWMTSESFYEYITTCFHPWLVKMKIELPIVLFVDGHASHVTFHISNYCSENGIILIALFPNATHIIQPMDVSAFRPLKCNWLKAVLDWRMEKNGARLTRELFPKLLEKVLDSDNYQSTIVNGFRKCGLFPFDANSIDYGLIKKGKLNDNVNENNNELAPKEIPNRFLTQFESQMDPNQLKEFKNSKREWQGDICEVALFKYWRQIGGIGSNISDDETNSIQLSGANDIIFEYVDATNEEFNFNVNGGEILNLDFDEITDINLTHDKHYNYVRAGDDLSDDKTDDEPSDDGQTDEERTNNEPGADQSGEDVSTNTTSGFVLVQDKAVYSAVTSINCDASDEYIPTMNPVISPVTNSGSIEPANCFRDLLFWPGINATSGKPGLKRKKEKVKIPAVLTSEDAMKYLKAKEDEKERLEAEKIDREKQRELKKKEKQKIEEQKNKQKEERRKQMMMKAELEKAKKEKRETEKKQRSDAKKAGKVAAGKLRDNGKQRKRGKV